MRQISHSDSAPHVQLSEREEEVLMLVTRGLPNKMIAKELDIGVRSVETYRARAMQKLGLKTRAEVIEYAISVGWFIWNVQLEPHRHALDLQQRNRSRARRSFV